MLLLAVARETDTTNAIHNNGNNIATTTATTNNSNTNTAYLIQVMVKTADGQLMPVHIPAAMPASGVGGTAAAATATAAAGAPGGALPLATINASNIVGPNAAATAAALNLPLIGGVSPPGQTAAQLQLPGSGNVNQTIIKQEVINPSNSFVTSLGVTSTTGNSSVSLTTKQVSFTFSSQPTYTCVLRMLECTCVR